MKSGSFLHYLTSRNKLTFRNIRTGEELWHIFVSRLHLLGAGLAILVLTFLLVLLVVAYTPILDLVPGNPGSKSRELLVANIERLDSLEQEVRAWEAYNNNMLLILDGGTPAQVSDSTAATSAGAKGNVVGRSIEDSLLRLRHAGDSAYVGANVRRKRAELTFEMMPPVTGIIAQKFNPKNNIYGITLNPTPGQVVLGVMDGTVIFDAWDPKYGQVLIVQHAANMMSVYKNAARSLKRVGERVRAGEPLAVTSSGKVAGGGVEPSTLVFELWQNGAPVDPENYIAF